MLCILGLALYPQLILKRTDAPCRRPSGGRRRKNEAAHSGSTAPSEEAARASTPHIDYAGLSPIIALTAGICVVLLTARFGRCKRPPRRSPADAGDDRRAADLAVGGAKDLVAGALRLDELAIAVSLIAILTAGVAVLLSIGEPAVEQAGSGEYHALLLGSVLGMVLLAQAQNLISFFVAIETLSIPLYILCATNLRREESLERASST